MSSDERGPAHDRRGRRTLLADGPFQLKYAGMIAAASLALAATTAILLYWAHAEGRGPDRLERLLNPRAAEAELTFLCVAWVAPILTAALLWGFALLVTHRVAGPLRVMESFLDRLAQGHLPRARSLRKGDELQVLFARLGRALDALREREEAEAAALDRAVARMGESCPLAVRSELTALVAAKRARASGGQPSGGVDS